MVGTKGMAEKRPPKRGLNDFGFRRIRFQIPSVMSDFPLFGMAAMPIPLLFGYCFIDSNLTKIINTIILFSFHSTGYSIKLFNTFGHPLFQKIII